MKTAEALNAATISAAVLGLSVADDVVVNESEAAARSSRPLNETTTASPPLPPAPATAIETTFVIWSIALWKGRSTFRSSSTTSPWNPRRCLARTSEALR